jgi:hypothetical protein
MSNNHFPVGHVSFTPDGVEIVSCYHFDGKCAALFIAFATIDRLWSFICLMLHVVGLINDG